MGEFRGGLIRRGTHKEGLIKGGITERVTYKEERL